MVLIIAKNHIFARMAPSVPLHWQIQPDSHARLTTEIPFQMKSVLRPLIVQFLYPLLVHVESKGLYTKAPGISTGIILGDGSILCFWVLVTASIQVNANAFYRLHKLAIQAVRCKGGPKVLQMTLLTYLWGSIDLLWFWIFWYN